MVAEVGDFEAEAWSRFWDWTLVEILRLNFGGGIEADQNFEADFWKFWGLSLVEILRVSFGRYFEAELWWR